LFYFIVSLFFLFFHFFKEDLKGLGLSHLYKPATRLVVKISEWDEKHFPESVYKVFVLNQPTIFSVFWLMLKPVLNQRTVEKISFCGADLTPIFNEIDSNQLPVDIGGTCEAHKSQQCMNKGGKLESNHETSLMKSITINAGAKSDISYEVIAGSIFVYQFEAEDRDILFSVFIVDKDGNKTEIHNAKDRITQFDGSKVIDSDGTIFIQFDNSFSLFRKKVIRYFVSIENPPKKEKKEKKTKKKNKKNK